MNRVTLMGTLTKDPEVRYTQGAEPKAVARINLAIDRKKENGNSESNAADYISCVAFDDVAQFIEKKVKKGSKVLVIGRMQTGSYTNKDGQKVYTTDVYVEECMVVGCVDCMNKVYLLGRLTADPEVRYAQGDNPLAIARFRHAVSRRLSKNASEGAQDTDFISCVAFGKRAEVIEKYFHKGSKVLLTGRMQTGSYTNKDGQKVYTTDVVVEDFEFVESKKSGEENVGGGSSNFDGMGGFMGIPDGIGEEFPFPV